MKIIYLANIRMPTEKAHGIQIMKMCEAFAAKNIAVELLVPRRWNDLKQDPFDFYNIKRTFRIARIPCLDFVFFDFFNIGFLISTISFLIFTKIYLFFRNYDVLYTREQLTGILFKDFILEMHLLSKRMDCFRKHLLKQAKKVIALTDLMKKRLMDLGISENKLLVSPDAADIKEFDISISKEDARRKVNLPLDKKIILYTGSFLLYDWKGVDILLKAAQAFPDDYLLVLVGGHPWEMEKIGQEYNLEKIRLVPYARHQIIPFYLKSADILVIPNKGGDKASEKYTSPLKLFEYMASRRPIISSDLPSMREILTEKEAMFFIPNNIEDLIGIIKKLLGDGKLQQELSASAFSKVRNYTWDRRVDTIIKELWPKIF